MVLCSDRGLLLCMTSRLSIAKEDFYFTGVCCFSFHILVIDHFSPKGRRVKMSCIQFLFVESYGMIPTILFEHPEFILYCRHGRPISYAGIMSCGVGYTCRFVAQKIRGPTVTSLLLSLESVFLQYYRLGDS